MADEPTGNLDTKNGLMIMELLKDLHEKGNTIIMVTHDAKLADYAERILTVVDGRITDSLDESKKKDAKESKPKKTTKKAKKKASKKKKGKK